MLCALAALPGCGGSAPEEAPETKNIVEYTVRGRVIAIPQPDRPASEFVVHHEPLPSYMSGGEVVGMPAMHMPFPLGKGVSLADIQPGDPVTITFDVVYHPETGIPVDMFVTRIVELPGDTPLNLDE